MKKYLFLSLIVILVFTSCNEYSTPSADEKDNEKQEQIVKQGQERVGMPGIINFQEKKQLKLIYELRDNEKLINYAYVWSDMQGKARFIGKCIGYGIPYATQYSNPQKFELFAGGYNNGFGAMPQAEPNGLFMPASAEGTWVILLDDAGVGHPLYLEPRIIVSATPLPATMVFKD